MANGRKRSEWERRDEEIAKLDHYDLKISEGLHKLQVAWMEELLAQGVQVNGATPEERVKQYELATWKPQVTKRRPTPQEALKYAAAAFRRARNKEIIRIDLTTGFYVSTSYPYSVNRSTKGTRACKDGNLLGGWWS
jgi:Rad3-related DNA helicase